MNMTPGVVVTTSPLTVRVDGAVTAVPARRLASYDPGVGDRVTLVPFSSEVLILGKII